VSEAKLLLSLVFLGLTVGVLSVVVVAQQFMIMQLNAAVRAMVNYLEEADQ
jgi:uncharacterized coiled-coil protein SlyX